MKEAPGPAPASGKVTGRAAEVRELLGRLKLLELAGRRNAVSHLSGDYATSILGRGLLFEEARKYVPGQPARLIDWNATARSGEPYVKVHRQERQREVFLALDVSPSMHTGFQAKTKLEVAVELAATLAVSAVEAGDRLGLVVFADGVLAALRPRSGRAQLAAVLAALLEATAPWERPVAASDPRAAVHAIQRHRGSRFVVFLISDFLDHDVPEDLKYLRARHDVSLLHVYDPVEVAEGPSPAPAVLRGVAPEAAAKARPLRPGEAGDLAEAERILREPCARLRIALGSFSTAKPVAASLGAFLAAKRRRR